MQLNRKVAMSIFILSILACVASAGTWAYFQDTLSSTGNHITVGKLGLYVNNVEGSADNTVTIPGIEVANIIPDALVHNADGSSAPNRFIESFTVENRGSHTGYLYIEAANMVNTLDDPNTQSRLLISYTPYSSGYVPIFNFNQNVATTAIFITKMDPGSNLPIDLMYNFPDTGQSQNGLEGKELKFDLKFILSSKRV
jgi:predicted ribosomally synthesized peptide with SipW-like signal peptide